MKGHINFPNYVYNRICNYLLHHYPRLVAVDLVVFQPQLLQTLHHEQYHSRQQKGFHYLVQARDNLNQYQPRQNYKYNQDSFITVPGQPEETDLKVYDWRGNFIGTKRALYSSVGIHRIIDDTPQMVIGLPVVDLDGVQALLPFYSNENVIAITDFFTNSGGYLLRKDKIKFFWNHFIDRYPFCAATLDGNTVWSAMQGEDTPEPDDYSAWLVDGATPEPPVEEIHVTARSGQKVIVTVV